MTASNDINPQPWTYKGEPFETNMVDDTDYSFIYLITNKLNGMKYVGKKVLFNKLRKPPLAGKKRMRIITKPSNWPKYWGSSKYLNEAIELSPNGRSDFNREILFFFKNKAEANLAEAAYQILYSVLDDRDINGERIWYNANIMRQFQPSEKYGEMRLKFMDDLISTRK